MRPRRPLRMLCALCLAAVGAGCASTQKSMPVPYELQLEVDPGVNPNRQDQPSPIMVGLYALGSDSQFLTLDFQALQDRARSSLGPDLVAVDQLILHPGEHRLLRRQGDPAVRYLGVVAGYRQLGGRRWRQSVPLPGARSTNLYKFWQTTPHHVSIRIEVGRQGLTIKPRH